MTEKHAFLRSKLKHIGPDGLHVIFFSEDKLLTQASIFHKKIVGEWSKQGVPGAVVRTLVWRGANM